MANQHADPPLTVRPPAGVKTRAQNILKERSLEMRGFIVACLTALTTDPDGFLAHLQPYWPAPKARGRPREERS